MCNSDDAQNRSANAQAQVRVDLFRRIPADAADGLSLDSLDAASINVFFNATLRAYSDFPATTGKTARALVWQRLLEALWADPRVTRQT